MAGKKIISDLLWYKKKRHTKKEEEEKLEGMGHES